MQLTRYMSNAFPGLSLKPALFYRWSIGIRFELGVEGQDIPYDEVVIRRATTIYESVFRAGDLGYMVASQTRYRPLKGKAISVKPHRNRPSIFQLSRRYGLRVHGPAGREIQTEDDGDLREITTYRWTEIAALNIDYRFVLKAKANSELYRRRPATDDRIYFVNRTRNILLHMYDDRGMDVVAAERSDLQTIYTKHQSWILDYDRKRIDEIFGGG